MVDGDGTGTVVALSKLDIATAQLDTDHGPAFGKWRVDRMFHVCIMRAGRVPEKRTRIKVEPGAPAGSGCAVLKKSSLGGRLCP